MGINRDKNKHIIDESGPLIILIRYKQIQRLKVTCYAYLMFLSEHALKNLCLMFQMIGKWNHDMIQYVR